MRRCRDEGVDARPAGLPHRFAAARDVARDGAGKAGDYGVPSAFSDGGYRLEIAFGGDRKPRLDNIDAHRVEEARHLQFLLEGHRGARRLFAVP